MKKSTENILEKLCERYPALIGVKLEIAKTFGIMQAAILCGKKIMVCGNGGSAADSEHIVGELLKSFKKPRPIDAFIYEELGKYGDCGERLRKTLEGSIRAIALTSHLALSTAFSNDKEPSAVFAQQLYGLGDCGDVLICISTSGKSQNCVMAAVTAKVMGISVVSFTGQKESELSGLSDAVIAVPETETYLVQELHLPVYHCLCAMLEEENF